MPFHFLVLCLVIGVAGCQSATPTASSSASPPGSATPGTAAPPVGTSLTFPSRNGLAALPAGITLTGSQAVSRFATPNGPIETPLEGQAGAWQVRKPLAAPASGNLEILAGERVVGTATYQANQDLIDVALDVQEASLPVQVSPAEGTGVVGNRRIRVAPGTALKLILPEGNLALGEVQVNAAGEVSSLPGIARGGPATLTLDVIPLRLQMADTRLPVRLVRYETAFAGGSRLVRVFPGVPLSLALGDNSLQIEGIHVAADGTVSHPQGHVATAKGEIIPATVPIRIDPSLYTGPWRLTRYEDTQAAGARTITCLSADRWLVVAFGSASLLSEAVNPAVNGTFGPITVDQGSMRFNLRGLQVDTTDLAVDTQVRPFEVGSGSGRRTVYVPAMPLQGSLGLASQGEPLGSFTVDADGSVRTTSASLGVANGMLKPNTRHVRVDVAGIAAAWRALPFELAFTPGTRTVAMVRGSTAQIQMGSRSIPLTIDDGGTLTSSDPYVQISADGIRVTSTP